MKLNELGARRPTEQIAKVFESQHGTRIDFDRIGTQQAKKMLNKVRALVREHRASPSFHYSERNPDYMKLVMMEQALSAKVAEQTVAGAVAPGAAAVDPKKTAALQAAQVQQNKRQIQDMIKQKQKEISDLQRQMNMPTMAESRRKLRESEIQQAQVVLAAQDMVDQLQKNMEQVSAMQFKDLPALTDAIKNDMGTEQAAKFQADATAALTQLLTAIQTAKTQMETAQGVLTGQAPVVPGEEPELGADLGADAGFPDADTDTDLDADLSLDANLDVEDDEEAPAATLGRERR
jgi:hypothetical protein